MFTPLPLVPGSLLTDTAATYYAPNNASAVVTACTLCNSSGGNRTVTLYKVPNGGTADGSNVILDGVQIGAGKTRLVPELVNQVLASGDSIQALADTGGDVNLVVSGYEVSQ